MRRSVTEHELVVMAALAWAAARLSLGFPLLPAVGVFTIAFALRRPKILIVAVFLLSSALGARAELDYRSLTPESRSDIGRLVTDPRPLGLHSWRAEFKSDEGHRMLLRASGPPAWKLADAQAGDRLEIAGSRQSLPDGDWYKSRHLVASFSLTEVRLIDGPPDWQLPATLLRKAVTAGGELVGSENGALYTGLVIGDDRFQRPSQQEKFRAVGLAHLLAVSGQNVAFALAVSAPLLTRLNRTVGFGVTLAVLLWFAIATRFEPSVIRATVTAAIAAWSTVRGTRASGVRVLALTVVVALGLDPFLVYSVGFSLSVLASAGIIIGSEVLATRLPGPSWFRLPLSITLSAQLAVAPLLIATFGPLSTASIFANMAAGWAAGLVMAWGLSGGVIAAFLPPALGQIVQAPVGWMVWWIDFVANASWRVRFPIFGGHAVVPVIGLIITIWLFGRRLTVLRLPAAVALAGLLIVAMPASPTGPVTLEGGARFWPAEDNSDSVLVVNSRSDLRLVSSIVGQRITQVDYLILTRGNRNTAALTSEIQRLVDAAVVIAPPQHRVPGATRLLGSAELRVGGHVLALEPTPDTIEVVARSR